MSRKQLCSIWPLPCDLFATDKFLEPSSYQSYEQSYVRGPVVIYIHFKMAESCYAEKKDNLMSQDYWTVFGFRHMTTFYAIPGAYCLGLL